MASSVDALADELESCIRMQANPQRAVSERRYLKSDLAFYSAGLPAVRTKVREFERERPLDRALLLAVVQALWSEPIHGGG